MQSHLNADKLWNQKAEAAELKDVSLGERGHQELSSRTGEIVS